MGIPEEACSGVFVGKTPINIEAPSYTYRENALSQASSNLAPFVRTCAPGDAWASRFLASGFVLK